MKFKPTKLVKWKDSRAKEIISRNVEVLTSILRIDENGKLSIESSKFDACIKILCHSIKIENVNFEIKKRLITKTVMHRLPRYKDKNIYTFRNGLAAEVYKYLNTPKNTGYSFDLTP